MTTQTKKFIEIEDIVGIQIECKRCGVSLLVGGETMRSLSDAHGAHPVSTDGRFPLTRLLAVSMMKSRNSCGRWKK